MYDRRQQNDIQDDTSSDRIKCTLASVELHFERLSRRRACVSAELSKRSERELDMNMNECTTDSFTQYRSLSFGYSEYRGCGDFAALQPW